MLLRALSMPFAAVRTVLCALLALMLILAPASLVYAQEGSCPAAPGEPPCGAGDGPASLGDRSGVDVAIGNPVHALTGAKAQTELDAAPAPGALGLEIRRHYSSAYAGVAGPVGAGWTLSYDTRLFRVGRTAQIIQADGRRVIFQIGGRAEAPTCTGERPDEGELEVRVSSPGAGYRWRWPDGREIDFDERGLLTRIRQTGPDGRALSVVVTRNAAGAIEQVVDPQGRTMRLHHDASGHLARIDHPDGSWRYRVSPAGGLLAVVAPNGVERRYEYTDPGHPFRLTAIRMAAVDGHLAAGHLVASWAYGGDGRVVEARVGLKRFRFDHDSKDEPATRVTSSAGDWVRYRYRTVAGRIRPTAIDTAVCAQCPPDHRLLDYDAAGRIVRTRWRPAGGTMTDIRFERDDRGRVTRIVAAGRDAMGAPRWLRRFEYADGPSPRPTLIARPSVEPGREHQLILSWGVTAATRNRLVRIDERGFRDGLPIERTVRYRHDDSGQLTSIDGPLPGESDSYRVIRDPGRPGRVIGLLDPLGRPVTPSRAQALAGVPLWAGLGGPADPDPANIQVATGEIVHRAANGATTRIIVDDFGRTIRIASDDAGVERLEYDEADRVVLNRDANGASVSLRHDVAGRPLERIVVAPGGEIEVTRYRYGADRSVAVVHPVADETVLRDEAGRIIERTVTWKVGPLAGKPFVRRYRYRGEERLPVEIDLPDGTRLTLTDEKGQAGSGAEQVVRWTGHASSTAVDLWRRRSVGNGLQWDLGNGVVRRLLRDEKHRVRSIEDRRGEQAIERRSIGYDRNGRIAVVDDGKGGWRYAYDSRGRLIIAEPADRVSSESAAWWYAHDENGNRLLAKAPAQVVRQPADQASADASRALPADRPIRLAYGPASNRAVGPLYDQAGRPLRWQGFDLGWHAGGRIATVTRDGQAVARYHYNHRGERVAKEIGSDWTYFDYEDGRLVMQQRFGEPGMRHFIHDGERPLVMIDALPAAAGMLDRFLGRHDAVRWLHLDHRGAPVASTDRHGRVVWTAHLSPDGERLPDSSGPDHEDPRLRLPGQYHDAETGWHDNLHRTYDPKLGRYLSPDPLGLRAGANPYLYAGGDPINKVDPTGLLLFAFDGTWNLPTSRTNVDIMHQHYAVQVGERPQRDGKTSYYEPGIGTTGSRLNQIYQGITADEWTNAVDNQFQRFVKAAESLAPGELLNIDVIGFSRGAIQARAFGQRVARAIHEGTVRTQGQIALRFMGLYDAVSTNMFDGISADRLPCLIGIAAEWQHVTHLVALNEHRPQFRAVGLGTMAESTGVRREIALVGAHSNIGGGYDPAASPDPVSDRSDLSNVALWIMLEEARQAGVAFRPLASDHLKITAAVLNDETHGSRGDPERMIEVDGRLHRLEGSGVGGLSRADSLSLGAPRSRLEYWNGPGSFPAGQVPNVVGNIDLPAYCKALVAGLLLSKCPP